MENHHLKSLTEEYLMQKNIAAATLKTYRIVFKHYISYLEENHILYAKTSDVIHYRESKRRLGYSSEWVYIQISGLKGLYRYLRINQKRFDLSDQYAYDIMIPIKNERIKHHIKKTILTLDQAKHMILHTKNTRKYIWHYRDHAIIYLMMTSGLRRIEIIHAKRNNFKMVDGQYLLYIETNGRRDDLEFVKVSEGASCALNDYLNKRKDDNPYLFVSHKNTSSEGYLSRTFFWYMFPRVLKECNLLGLGITPHCLRHTAATFNLLRGGTLEQTKSLMRHSNIQSTLIYQHHIERMKDNSEEQIESFILREDMFIFYNEFISLFES